MHVIHQAWIILDHCRRSDLRSWDEVNDKWRSLKDPLRRRIQYAFTFLIFTPACNFRYAEIIHPEENAGKSPPPCTALGPYRPRPLPLSLRPNIDPASPPRRPTMRSDAPPRPRPLVPGVAGHRGPCVALMLRRQCKRGCQTVNALQTERSMCCSLIRPTSPILSFIYPSSSSSPVSSAAAGASSSSSSSSSSASSSSFSCNAPRCSPYVARYLSADETTR